MFPLLLTYSVLKVGQIRVPSEAHNIDIHDTELGREVVEVDCLCKRPHTQVHLQTRTEKDLTRS